MPSERQRDAVYATACMAVLVFAAFFGAYSGVPIRRLCTSLPAIQTQSQDDTCEATMPKHDDRHNSAQAANAESDTQDEGGDSTAKANTTPVGTLSQSDNIQVLLHEYDGLRSEIVQRWVGMQQQISIGVVVLLGIVAVLFSKDSKIDHPRDYILYSLLGFAMCVFCYAMWQVGRDSGKAAKRVREIEREVNQRAGAELLQWETRWGGGATGYWGSARPIKKSEDDPKAN
jgi:hypothetical protein